MTEPLDLDRGEKLLAELKKQEAADDPERSHPSGALRRAHSAFQTWLLDEGVDRREQLIAAARRLEELESALDWLDADGARLVSDYRAPGETESSLCAFSLLARAKRLGWDPKAKDGG